MIRKLERKDKENWIKLYCGYAKFYKVSMKMQRNYTIKQRITQVLNSMNLKGTKFQLKVWNYLRKIPKGKVKTYLEVAKAIGKPKAFRAVANAVGKNPYPPKIPCHRVIRSDGSLGGCSGKGGIKQKRRLLRLEKILIKQSFIYIKCLN